MTEVRTSVPAVDRGRIVASILQGAWRRQPAPASVSQEQLELVVPILARSGTAGLAWRRIRETPLASTEPGRGLQSARRIQAAQAAIRLAQIEQVLSQDGMSEVDPILVKGYAHGRFYPEKAVRHYTDIDFLVRPERYDLALRASGRAVPLDPERAIPVDIQETWLDLPERSWEQLYEHSEMFAVGNRQVRVLGHEDSLRLSCLHMLRHLGFQPLWLSDISAMLESLPNSFDWAYCLRGETRRTQWMLAAFRLANQVLGARLDGCPERLLPKRIPAWMMRAMLRWWGSESTFIYPWPLPPHITSVARADPRRVPRAFAERWPDPLQAVGRFSWPINRFSGRMAQVLDFTNRAFTWGPRHLGRGH